MPVRTLAALSRVVQWGVPEWRLHEKDKHTITIAQLFDCVKNLVRFYWKLLPYNKLLVIPAPSGAYLIELNPLLPFGGAGGEAD